MNQDAKAFLKMAALSFAPSVVLIGLLLLVVMMFGCSASHELGYVIEDQNGTQVVCKEYSSLGYKCGVKTWNCDDGVTRYCLTNVKIRKVEP